MCRARAALPGAPALVDAAPADRYGAGMGQSARRPNARHAILDAAARLVLRDGVAHLTLDAVAAELARRAGGKGTQ